MQSGDFLGADPIADFANRPLPKLPFVIDERPYGNTGTEWYFTTKDKRQTCSFLHVRHDYWFGSCAGILLGYLGGTSERALSLAYVPEGYLTEVRENLALITLDIRQQLLATKLNCFQSRIPNYKNFWYLVVDGAYDKYDYTRKFTGKDYGQAEVIKFLSGLGFEKIQGSEMRNPAHVSLLSIYARLVK